MKRAEEEDNEVDGMAASATVVIMVAAASAIELISVGSAMVILEEGIRGLFRPRMPVLSTVVNYSLSLPSPLLSVLPPV